MNKEAIELIEKAQEHLERFGGSSSHCHDYIAQALAKLRTAQEPCKTCGDTKKVYCDECGGSCDFKAAGGDYSCMCRKCDWHGKIPCPDCTAQEQPPASEFTKLARKAIVCLSLVEADEMGNIKDEKGIESSIEVLFRACDRLDHSEASRKELLEACKFAVNPEAPYKVDNLEFANEIIKAIADKAEAAIAEAKKEG